jgi:putative CocE/NonD family hydrolase
LSGWHDDSYGTEGAATNYNGIAGSRRESSETRNHLVLGPWNHGVGATAARQIGDLDFGETAGIDYDDVLLRFFDQYLRKVDTGLETAAPVRYFVMGENEWRESGTWPPASVSANALCFETDAESDSGGLGECGRATDATSSRFIADPSNPVHDLYDTRGAHDYRPLRSRPDAGIRNSGSRQQRDGCRQCDRARFRFLRLRGFRPMGAHAGCIPGRALHEPHEPWRRFLARELS